jgi:hypothetical protein
MSETTAYKLWSGVALHAMHPDTFEIKQAP